MDTSCRTNGNLASLPAIGLAAALCLAAAPACEDGDGVSKADETPSKQFILGGVSITERSGGKVQWHATAARADGDLRSADLEDVVLTQPRSSNSAARYTVRSPRGRFLFEAGEATFEAVQINDDEGAQIDAGEARYDKAAQTIETGGPLRFSAPGLVANATAGVLHLGTHRVSIRGPVVGRYTPLPRRSSDLPPD